MVVEGILMHAVSMSCAIWYSSTHRVIRSEPGCCSWVIARVPAAFAVCRNQIAIAAAQTTYTGNLTHV
jgi:hypothetical protein